MQKAKIRDLKSNFGEFLVKNLKKIGIKKNDCGAGAYNSHRSY